MPKGHPIPRVSITLLVLFTLLSGTVALAQDYHEAPTLAERVAAGELPPVAERLPANPLVVEPVERVGDYGGTWRGAILGAADSYWLVRTVGYEHLLRWDPGWTQPIPNIAASFEANDDATEFTFTLREGLKWSDGEPFTADDILFWYEAVFSNDELPLTQHPRFISGGEPVVVEKQNNTTVLFRFAAPNGLFLQHLAGVEGDTPTRYPRHYLAQFHPDTNPDGIDALIAEAGVADWVALFERMGGGRQGLAEDARWQNPALPTLNGWLLTSPLSDPNRVVLERNPYYFKVDTAGNQLPYIDRVVFDQVADNEVLLLKALNGEIDFQSRHITGIANKAVLTDNMTAGDYHFFDITGDGMNTVLISLNLTHEDPVKREMFNNKDFRIGLSYAIDRQEIIDTIFIGQGEPWQTAPRPNSPFYDEEMAKQYTTFDTDLANEHLDSAGYTGRDAQGFRLGPDGRRISFTTEILTPNDPLELIQQYWRAVGIDMQIRLIDRSLLFTRKKANLHDAVVTSSEGGLNPILDPRYYFPVNDESNFAIPWAYWYEGNPQGEEPPERAKQQQALYSQLIMTADPDAQHELMREILAISKEQFYTIGVSLPSGDYGLVKNSFRNVPSSMPGAHLYPNPGPTNPSQYFIEGGSR